MNRFFTIILIIAGILFLIPETKASCWNSSKLEIDSFSQLEDYDFIAHVKIVDTPECIYSLEEEYKSHIIEIIELFKGDSINQILDYSISSNDIWSNVDIGISKDEEWILFGKTIDGKISIIGCDRNKRYKKSDGLRNWRGNTGLFELHRLRELYQHPIPQYVNEKREEFYSNEQKEIEETYVNGLLHGERKIWYPNGVLFCKQHYKNGVLIGKSEWFHPSGETWE